MVKDLLILLGSLVFLLYSADKLVDAAVKFATRIGMSKMTVGLTIVAVGTSLPEIMASSAAAWAGHPEIALGNVVGSNICNVGLIFGIPALFSVITARRSVVMREGVLMISVSLLLFVAALLMGSLGRPLGFTFVLGYLAFLYVVFKKATETKSEVETSSVDEMSEASETSPLRRIIELVVSLAILLLSSDLLVDSTVSLARGLGISEAVIAISVIALGTSLPELSVSLAAAKRGEGDILVGNILGSNISNILLVLGVSAIIKPIPVSAITLAFDLPMMLFLALLMVGFLFQEKGIGRGKGILFLSLYGVVIVRCILYPNG